MGHNWASHTTGVMLRTQAPDPINWSSRPGQAIISSISPKWKDLYYQSDNIRKDN